MIIKSYQLNETVFLGIFSGTRCAVSRPQEDRLTDILLVRQIAFWGPFLVAINVSRRRMISG
jgi:hypothetical protein